MHSYSSQSEDIASIITGEFSDSVCEVALAPESLPKWLQGQLDRREWSQADFARKLGVSTGLVSNWFTGVRRPNPESCARIADVLFADRDEVLAIAGHRDPDLDLDALDRFHRIVDPYAREIDWTDEENVIEIRYALDHIIRIQERRSGKRSLEQWHDPVEKEEG
jgi:transcriptional regulator with XRE-family HTH domain